MAEYDLDEWQRKQLRELVDLTRGLSERLFERAVATFASEGADEWVCVTMQRPVRLTDTDVAHFAAEGLITPTGPGRFVLANAAVRAVDADFRKPDHPALAGILIQSAGGPVQVAVGDHNALAQRVEPGELAGKLVELLGTLVDQLRDAVPAHDMAAIEAAAAEAKADPSHAVGPLRRIGTSLGSALESVGRKADAVDKIAKAHGHLGQLLTIVAAMM